MNKFLDVYSPEPSKSISKSGSYLLDVVVQASTTMFFTTSQYLEASFVLLDSKLEAFKFFASRWYGTDQSGVSPGVTLQLYALSIDKEKRKLYYTGFGSASGGSGQFLSTTAVDIPAGFNLDGPIYVQVGGEKNYTSAGGNHTLTIERRSLTVLTS